MNAEQCYTFGIIGTIGIVLSFVLSKNLPNISGASLIIGVSLIGIALIGSIYISFKSINNLHKKRVADEAIE